MAELLSIMLTLIILGCAFLAILSTIVLVVILGFEHLEEREMARERDREMKK